MRIVEVTIDGRGKMGLVGASEEYRSGGIAWRNPSLWSTRFQP